MYHHEHSSFMIAAALSIAVHATAVVYSGHDPAPLADRPQSTVSLMKISLAPGKPAAPPPKPPLAPEIREEPRPSPPVPKPVIKREPRPEPVIEPAPASTAITETAELGGEQRVATDYVEAPLDKPALAQRALEHERESYLLRLLAHIDSHKFYPRTARRRGTEGEIQVAFYLHRDGNISDLQITGGSKVLRKAAKQALQQSLSLPPPPESMPLLEPIRFGMVYRLDG